MTRRRRAGRATTSDRTPTTPSPWSVDVALEPATTYWYRFEAGASARRSAGPGRSPADGADRVPHRHRVLRPATRSRRSASTGRWPSARSTSSSTSATTSTRTTGRSGGRDHDPPHVATTLDDYRRRLAQIRADPDAQALHLRHPVVTIWDDHDLADNAWRDGAKTHDPEEHGPWADRVAAAARARQEWLPAACRDPARPAHHVAVAARRRPRRAAAPRHPPAGPRPPGRRRRVAGPR